MVGGETGCWPGVPCGGAMEAAGWGCEPLWVVGGMSEGGCGGGAGDGLGGLGGGTKDASS